jgi:phosphoglycerate dehydrogenase-like enzyme
MNRRTFLTASTTTAALAATGAAAPLETARRRGADRLKVLVPAMTPEQIAELTAVAPQAELIVCRDGHEAVARAPGAVAAYGFITRELLAAGKDLRWVQQGSAGVEHLVAIPELVEGDVVLTNMQRVLAPEIADQALAYLLSFTRGLVPFILGRSSEEWGSPGPAAVFDELDGKTLLVIALGGIGSQIARRARGFGMRVLATDPKVLEKPEFVEELHRPDAFARLLPRADVVASAVPLTSQTRKMIGAGEFAAMKRGVILINVSRGGVVDTDALVAALQSGQVAAAGLDVTDPEPLPKGHPLWRQNVIITPHTAGQSPGGRQRSFVLFKENLRRFACGEMLLNVVDKRAGY